MMTEYVAQSFSLSVTSFASYDSTSAGSKLFLCYKKNQSLGLFQKWKETQLFETAIFYLLELLRNKITNSPHFFRRKNFRKDNIQFSSQRFFTFPDFAHDAQTSHIPEQNR